MNTKKLSCNAIARELVEIAGDSERFNRHVFDSRFEIKIDGLTIRCNGTQSDVLRVAEKYSKPLPGNKPFNARRAYTELNTVGPYEWWRTDRKSNLNLDELEREINADTERLTKSDLHPSVYNQLKNDGTLGDWENYLKEVNRV